MNKTCAICSSSIDEKKDYSVIKCSHEFHTSCLFQSRSPKCPLCHNCIIPLGIKIMNIYHNDAIDFYEYKDERTKNNNVYRKKNEN